MKMPLHWLGCLFFDKLLNLMNEIKSCVHDLLVSHFLKNNSQADPWTETSTDNSGTCAAGRNVVHNSS